MVVESILALLAGVGVFIVGMNLLSDGLQKSAGAGLKSLFGKISNNRFIGVGIGATVTAAIQSSSATSVMVIGFVNAGVMTLAQATSIIMGANIGTTVTGLLVSLSSLDIALYATALAFIGVMLSFIKKDNVKKIGGILCGLGLIFVGLDLMGAAFSNDVMKDFFANLFEKINFPLLLLLCGVVFTALMQSSSAATGLIIIMVGKGALTVESALFIVLGSNIGTCVTALLACMGATVNAKRTAFIHLTFNVIGTLIYTIVLLFFSKYIVSALGAVVNNVQMQIAWFHVLFNVSTTVILLPFVKQLVELSETIIKDKKVDSDELKLKFFDAHIMTTPSIALMQIKKEILYILDLAKDNFQKSLKTLAGEKNVDVEQIAKNEDIINYSNKALTEHLIALSSKVNGREEEIIGSYFHVLNDIERIGDHAMDFLATGKEIKTKKIAFSEVAVNELQTMIGRVLVMFNLSSSAFDTADRTILSSLTEVENEVDKMKKDLNDNHIQRLSGGLCSTDRSPYYFESILGIERVADHLINIGYSVVNPVGSQV